MSVPFSEREKLVDLLNRLFYYTDSRDWDGLKTEVFSDTVQMDMTSLGAPAAENWSAQRICDEWAKGFDGLDAIHHQAGNYILNIEGTSARGKAYAIASHYKKDAKHGKTREFVGSYDFRFSKVEGHWKLDSFKFNLKYMTGNLELQ